MCLWNLKLQSPGGKNRPSPHSITPTHIRTYRYTYTHTTIYTHSHAHTHTHTHTHPHHCALLACCVHENSAMCCAFKLKAVKSWWVNAGLGSPRVWLRLMDVVFTGCSVRPGRASVVAAASRRGHVWPSRSLMSESKMHWMCPIRSDQGLSRDDLHSALNHIGM